VAHAALAQAAEPAAAPAGGAAAGIIVKYRNEERGAALDARVLAADNAVKRRGATLRYGRSGALGIHVLKLDRTYPLTQAQDFAREIKNADPNVEYAEPDTIMYPTFAPDDPYYISQWHYHEAIGGINLPYAWDISTGLGTIVAVLDTGYRPHWDFGANLFAGYDFITNTTTAADGNGRDSNASDPGDWCGGNSTWHGTHVIGTIAAATNNAIGVAGVAFNSKVVPVRVLGKCGGDTSDIADAIIWASGGTVSGVPANGTPARVLNLSLGGPGACGTTFQNAINSARSRNSVVVVAAGNDNEDAANHAPANCTGVITVAATDREGNRAVFNATKASNYGASVEIAAPGGETSADESNGIRSTYNTGTTTPGSDSYKYLQGTSMAAPHVAGVAALMLAKNNTLTPDDVLSIIQSTARAFPGSCSQCGSGIVDAYAAVNAVPAPPTDNLTFYGDSTGWDTWSMFGYHSTMGVGSLTPNTTSDGKTIGAYVSVYEYSMDGGGGWYVSNQYTSLSISGFATNPGKEWLMTISGPGGVTLAGNNASFTCYGTQCVWTWPEAYDLQGSATLKITHR
jgi:serine protease